MSQIERRMDGTFGPGNRWAVKPGECRNPKGRPLSLRRVRRVLRERLEVETEAADPADPRRLRKIRRTRAEAVIEALIAAAEAGNVAAAQLVIESIDGKLPDRIEVERRERADAEQAAAEATDEELATLALRLIGRN